MQNRRLRLYYDVMLQYWSEKYLKTFLFAEAFDFVLGCAIF